MFMETAQELKIKGLQGDLQGLAYNQPEKQETSYQDTSCNEKAESKNIDILGQEEMEIERHRERRAEDKMVQEG